MTNQPKSLLWFSDQILKYDNITTELWNSLLDQANEMHIDEIYGAWEDGKECGSKMEFAYQREQEYYGVIDGMQYYEKEFGDDKK